MGLRVLKLSSCGVWLRSSWRFLASHGTGFNQKTHQLSNVSHLESTNKNNSIRPAITSISPHARAANRNTVPRVSSRMLRSFASHQTNAARFSAS